jgi:hypothetical protein
MASSEEMFLGRPVSWWVKVERTMVKRGILDGDYLDHILASPTDAEIREEIKNRYPKIEMMTLILSRGATLTIKNA